MDKEKFYEEDNEQSKELFSKESMIKKMARTGLLYLGVTALGKKASGGKYDLLNNDIVKVGLVTSLTHVLSEDNDTGGNLLSVSAYMLGGSKAKAYREELMNNPTRLAQFSEKMVDYDKKLNQFAEFSSNFTDWFGERFGDNFSNLNRGRDTSSSSVAKDIIGNVYTGGKAVLQTLKDPFLLGKDNISKSGFSDGLFKTFEDLSITREMIDLQAKYTQGYQSIEEILPTLRMKNDNLRNASIHLGEDGFFKGLTKKGLNKIGKTFFQIDEAFVINDTNLKKRQEIRRVIKHIENKENTFFQDMVGQYTSHGSDGISVRYDRILKDKMHYGTVLNDLANKFQKTNRVAINHSKKESILSPEQREANFVEFLRKSGFGEIVDNLYNKKDNGAITFGDVNKMISGKNLSIPNEKYSIEPSMLKGIQMGFGKEIFDSNTGSYKENIVNGLSNIDLLKNFTFTNVVKNVNGNILDETSLHGGLASLRVAGLIEKNIVAMYKNPFTNNKEIPISVWNPAKLIDSNNRMKNILANDIQKYELSENGFFLDKKMVSWIEEEGKREVVIGNKTRIQKDISYTFFTDNSRSYAIDYTKNTRDILDQSFKVAKENSKENFTLKDFKETYKAYGFKPMLHQMLGSNYNFSKLRYDGKFRVAKTDESYFTEGTILDFLAEKDYDLKKLKIDNRNIEKKAGQVGNVILATSVVNSLSKNEKELNLFLKEGFTSKVMDYEEKFYSKMIDTLGKMNKTMGMREDKYTEYLGDILDIKDKMGENTKILKHIKNLVKEFHTNPTEENLVKFGKLKSNITNIYEKSMGDLHTTGLFTDKRFTNIIGQEDLINYQKDFFQGLMADIELTDMKVSQKAFKDNLLSFTLSDPGTKKTLLTEETLGLINWYSRNYLEDFHKEGKFTKGVYEDFIIKANLGDIKYKSFKSFSQDGFSSELADTISGMSEKQRKALGNWRTNKETIQGIFENKVGLEKAKEMFEEHGKTKIINYAKYDYEDYAKFKNMDKNDLNEFKKISYGLDYTLEIAKAKSKNFKVLGGIINANSIVKDNYSNTYLNRYDFDNPDSVLNSVFEEALGYDYYNVHKLFGDSYTDHVKNSLHKLDFNNPMIKKVYGDLSEGVALREYEKNIFNDILGKNEKYRHLANRFFKDSIGEGEEYNNYKYFEHLKYNSKLNYFSAVKLHEDNNFFKRDKVLASSFIIQSSSKRFMEERVMLNGVKNFINNFIVTDRAKKYKSYADISEQDIKNTSFNFGTRETNFGIKMKTAFNNLQNAMEYIGIERVTSDKLGTSWQRQTINMMKYRVMPMTAVLTGAIALNSFSDMVVPDEVPIIGNGILGVGTRAYATGRIGLQYGLKYTGLLGAMKTINEHIPIFDNGLTSWFDPLMSPEEMTDVYFRGKAVRINKNRFWFTAGRQTGEGEEFDEYRPHLLYQWGNPTSGIYSNKAEKFFRQDFALTRYPWYILDPYKEEREMYENLGAVVPRTEQLFKDIPVFGHLLSMTIGEMIKPTQYVGEDQWKVGDNLMKNPNYNVNNPSSPEYMEYTEPNRLVQAIFEGVEDLKTFSGLPGFTLGILTNTVFGASNPYENDVTLTGTEEYTSMYRGYEKMDLGGLVGITEPIRRLLDDTDALGMISINPLKQDTPDWIPGYFKDGRNPYLTLSGGYYLKGDAFDKTYQSTGNEDVDKLKVLSMIAPKSRDFKAIERRVFENLDNLDNKEKKGYYESLSYAENYGSRLYSNSNQIAKNIENISLKIEERISPTEFISGGKRYKIDSIENDFNLISKNVGSRKAQRGMNFINQNFAENTTHEFKVSKDPLYSVGTDDKGDFIKLGTNEIPEYMQNKESVYRDKSFGILNMISNLTYRRIKNSPLPSHFEKAIGKRTAVQEWQYESVESPYFRDWDSPVTSFVEPVFNFSSNHLVSGIAFHNFTKEAFQNSNANINVLGLLNLAGLTKLPFNFLTGSTDKSSDYEHASYVSEELEKIKYISNNKSIYTMTGNENIKTMTKMVSEADSPFLKDFMNVSNAKDREQILKIGDERLGTVLKHVWNRQARYLNSSSQDMYDTTLEKPTSVVNIGAYDGNIDRARIIIKNKARFSLSKLDEKRLGVTKSYRGGTSQKQADYIKTKMYENYNARPIIQSTIYPKGTIDIVGEE